MAAYSFYNLGFSVLVLLASYWVAAPDNRKRHLLLAARIALLITVLLYPWDFFAIRLGVWTYPKDPGLRIYGVPLNDSFFIWLCSFLAAVILIRVDRRGHPGSQSHSQRHKTIDQYGGDNGARSS